MKTRGFGEVRHIDGCLCELCTEAREKDSSEIHESEKEIYWRERFERVSKEKEEIGKQHQYWYNRYLALSEQQPTRDYQATIDKYSAENTDQAIEINRLQYTIKELEKDNADLVNKLQAEQDKKTQPSGLDVTADFEHLDYAQLLDFQSQYTVNDIEYWRIDRAIWYKSNETYRNSLVEAQTKLAERDSVDMATGHDDNSAEITKLRITVAVLAGMLASVYDNEL